LARGPGGGKSRGLLAPHSCLRRFVAFAHPFCLRPHAHHGNSGEGSRSGDLDGDTVVPLLPGLELAPVDGDGVES
jgi:hypothetical protein